MTKPHGGKVDAGRVMAALASRYRAPEFALFEQVGNGTGFTGNRWADAMAMSLWPSRGLDLYGFEIKVSRYDWQRELRNPSKAEDIATYCDFWFVVTSGPGVLELSEVPAPWGVLELSGRGLRQVKAAERRTPPAQLDRPMIAALLRRASEAMVPASSIAEKIAAAEDDAFERGKRVANSDGEQAKRDLAALREAVAEFQRASGVEILSYHGEHVGKRFAAAADLDAITAGWQINGAARALEEALRLVESVKNRTAGKPTDPADAAGGRF